MSGYCNCFRKGSPGSLPLFIVHVRFVHSNQCMVFPLLKTAALEESSSATSGRDRRWWARLAPSGGGIAIPSLEKILQGRLNVSIIALGAGDDAKRAGAQISARIAEFWRIQEIERFNAEHDPVAFELRNLKRFS
jgi:hypothetical protein